MERQFHERCRTSKALGRGGLNAEKTLRSTKGIKNKWSLTSFLAVERAESKRPGKEGISDWGKKMLGTELQAEGVFKVRVGHSGIHNRRGMHGGGTLEKSEVSR